MTTSRRLEGGGPQRSRHAPPYAFGLLHVCTGWPVGIVSLVLGNRLTALGVPVHRTATIITAAWLAFSLEFLWAPLVDSTFNRKGWYTAGAALMCASLALLLMAPWASSAVPLLTALTFISCSGAAMAAASIKGLMAYEIPAAQLGSASAFYTAGGYFAKAVGAAGTLWMLTHLTSRPLAGLVSAGIAAAAASAILLASPAQSLPWSSFAATLRATLGDAWNFVRTRRGAVTALLCVIPFGTGTEAGLVGAIAHEWHVGADQLNMWIAFSALGTISGAMLAGWLSTRISAWRSYLLLGSTMQVTVVVMAFAPRTPTAFLLLEFLYRALTGGCYATILGLVMDAIGKGAAATKAAVMWSLFNFAVVIPTMLEGDVHDRVGTTAMLLTDAALGLGGLGILVLTMRRLAFRFAKPVAPAAAL